MRTATFNRAVLMSALFGVVLAAVSPATIAGDSYRPRDDYTRPEMRIPGDNQLTPARIALGKALFFDPRLSGSNWISCATCHNPAMGWSDGLRKGIGEGQKELGRATPTILNTAYNRKQMWDGRMRSLEDQATGPIQAGVEMNQDMPSLIRELETVQGYRDMFEAAYPGEGISEKTIAKAIASFERTVVTADSPFDRWIKGDRTAMNVSAVRGLALFEGKAKCNACHQNFNFVDDGFHNIGLPDTDDPGRFAHVKVNILKGAFKTPTLRNVALTAPYMHNGVYSTLEEVVEHYNRGGVNKDNLDPNIEPLHLSESEKQDLIEFMKALTGEPLTVTYPRLPAL